MGETAKIAEALAKAQGAIQPAAKDSENPHFKSRYADLAAIMEVCRAPLSANGLAVVQEVKSDEAGVTCTTRLLHSSGESLESTLWLPVAQRTPQAYGSALTYARRYSLAALVGVVTDEDDDGNLASTHSKEHPPRKPHPKPAQKMERPEPEASPAPVHGPSVAPEPPAGPQKAGPKSPGEMSAEELDEAIAKGSAFLRAHPKHARRDELSQRWADLCAERDLRREELSRDPLAGIPTLEAQP